MSTFSNEEKVQILSDIVEMNTVNDNEIQVCEYFQNFSPNMASIQQLIK